MARILCSGEWYEQLATEALYEEEYERILIDQAENLFFNYRLIPFKMRVASEAGSAMPDFALVHRHYAEWWVVEAELSHHSLHGHVIPQVEVLSRATYGEVAAKYLCCRDLSLNVERMCSVVRGEQPRVLVIVNAAVPTWARDLRRFDAVVTVLEVFRSRHNTHLFRLNGEQPEGSARARSRCILELPRFLRVLAPGILPIQSGEKMPVRSRGGIVVWSRLDLRDRVYLVTGSPVSLQPRVSYELVEQEPLSFALIEGTEARDDSSAADRP